MQSRNPFIDDLARMAEYAADAAFAAGKEAKSAIRGSVEEVADRLDLVSRQDVAKLEEQLHNANQNIAALENRIATMENNLADAGRKTAKTRTQPKPAPKTKDTPD